MKILMLLEHNLPDIRIDNECYSLKKAGHDVVLLTGDKMPKLIYKSSIAHPWFPMYEFWWRKRIGDIFSQNKIDAIHVHDLPLARLGYEFSVNYNIPFILDLHENYPALLRNAIHTKRLLGRILHSNKAWIKYERKYVLLADQIITVCSEMAARIGLIIPEDNWNKIHVVKNTINIETLPLVGYKPISYIHEPLKIIYAGAINKHRGIQTVIEVVNLLNWKYHKCTTFTIAGEGSYKKKLMRKSSIYIRFMGKISYGNMLKELNESHIAIIPHIPNENNNASSPHKLFEYMYAGVTVITSACESIVRVIKETNCGYCYKEKNDLLNLLIKIHNNREMLKTGMNGRKAVNLKYNWNKDSKRLVDIYNNLKNA
jgi:glycosyltransferase involved in cell wall biosynthesis